MFYKGRSPNIFVFLPFNITPMKFPFLYFDPGTGALIAQAVAATAAAGALFYKRIVLMVKSVFGKKHEQDLMGDIDIEENANGTDSN